MSLNYSAQNKSATSMSSLLDLQTYSSPSTLPRYLILQSEKLCAFNAQCFSPQVMQWSDDTFLFDLGACAKFWHLQARKEGKDWIELFQDLIEKHYGAKSLAVFASHPWQALLLLKHAQEQKIRGTIVFQSPFGRRQFQGLSWRSWFSAFEELSSHWKEQRSNFDDGALRSQIARMQRAVKRLSLQSPWELKKATPEAMAKRFSSKIADAWTWTFFLSESDKTDQLELPLSLPGGNSDSQHSATLFPWKAWRNPVQPSIRRVLDHALPAASMKYWDQVEQALLEDLDRLCSHPAWQMGELVTLLRWELVLESMKSVVIEIPFRHPHNMHAELGAHRSTLFQAYFAFEKAMQDLVSREDDLDFPREIPFISWRVSVEERFRFHPRKQYLFSEDQSLSYKNQQLLEAENKIALPLSSYALNESFVPELSVKECFEEGIADWNQEDDALSSEMSLWERAALYRPLFAHESPRRISEQEISSERFHLEKTSEAWWSMNAPESLRSIHAPEAYWGKNAPSSETERSFARDYYLAQSAQSEMKWVFRDSGGAWYEQGQFS